MNFISELIAKLLSILPCFPVFAGTAKKTAVEFACNMIKETIDMAGGIGELINSIVNGGDGFTATLNNFMNTVAISGMNGIASVGVAIALALWLFNVVELAMQERLTLETFIKSTSRLVFAVVLCDITPDLFTGMVDFGKALSNDVISGLTDTTGNDSLSGILDSLEEGGTIYTNMMEDDVFFLAYYVEPVLFMLPMILIIAVVTIVTYVIQFSRLIELNVRAVFLPIAIASLADDGWKGAGGRYLRKFLAICCQGAVLIVIGMLMGYAVIGCLATALSNSGGILDVFQGFLIAVGCMIAGVGVMFKSMGIVSDVFGA